jgi:hypothetical protein
MPSPASFLHEQASIPADIAKQIKQERERDKEKEKEKEREREKESEASKRKLDKGKEKTDGATPPVTPPTAGAKRKIEDAEGETDGEGKVTDEAKRPRHTVTTTTYSCALSIASVGATRDSYADPCCAMCALQSFGRQSGAVPVASVVYSEQLQENDHFADDASILRGEQGHLVQERGKWRSAVHYPAERLQDAHLPDEVRPSGTPNESTQEHPPPLLLSSFYFFSAGSPSWATLSGS